MTINPPTGELTFQRNEESNTHVLKYTKDKKEKVYFCVSLNYSGDAVSILDWFTVAHQYTIKSIR